MSITTQDISVKLQELANRKVVGALARFLGSLGCLQLIHSCKTPRRMPVVEIYNFRIARTGKPEMVVLAGNGFHSIGVSKDGRRLVSCPAEYWTLHPTSPEERNTLRCMASYQLARDLLGHRYRQGDVQCVMHRLFSRFYVQSPNMVPRPSEVIVVEEVLDDALDFERPTKRQRVY